MTLVGRFFGSNAYDCYGAQGTFPYDFPGMSARPEPNFAPGPVCGLSDGVSVQREPVGFYVDIFGAILGVPGVTKGAEL